MNEFLNGDTLYGDTFSEVEIKNWFRDEQEGYANLSSNEGGKKKTKNSDISNYQYVYHALNTKYGYSNIPSEIKDIKVVSIGGAYGHELLPIIDRIKKISIIEPSLELRQEKLDGIPIDYVSPNISGVIDLGNACCDLVTCFGVLHHIPNVSFVLSELERIIKPEGYCLIREPIVSMGDWNSHRKGLTKNERGIPLNIFRDVLGKSGFKIKKEVLCTVTPFDSLFKIFGQPLNNDLYINVDYYLSKLFAFNYRYHPTSIFDKFRPVNVYYVLQKSS